MVPSQIEKLKKDSRELDHHIARMKKEGRSDVAARLLGKKAHIDSYIEQITDESRYTSKWDFSYRH
jgi:hypothetical protein